MATAGCDGTCLRALTRIDVTSAAQQQSCETLCCGCASVLHPLSPLVQELQKFRVYGC